MGERAGTHGEITLDQVVRAIETLGSGLLAHDENEEIRRRLDTGELATREFYHQVLRVVYRVLFLSIGEDQGMLHPPGAGAASRALYSTRHSIRRLREIAEASRDGTSSDHWRSLCEVFQALAQPRGCARLGLPAFGAWLWSHESTPDLRGPGGSCARIPDEAVVAAVRLLSTAEPGGLVDFRQVATVRLGSIYESLLGHCADVDLHRRRLSLRAGGANERRSSGSFYTPEPLVEHLLDSALEPVIEERLSDAGEMGAEVILGIRVCDPACGAGHFLVGAARRLGVRLARERARGRVPTAHEEQSALGDVIEHCIYGVDLDPMACELCRFTLWLEAREPALAMATIGNHVRVGNSLLGATPGVMAGGVPSSAFHTLDGDAPEVVRYYKKRNTHERENHHARRATRASDERLLADAWCAAFVWKKHDTDRADAVEGFPGRWDAMTESVYRAIERDPHGVKAWLREEIHRVARAHRFFHWRLEFPEVFDCQQDSDDLGGFDVVVGNPPFQNQLGAATAVGKGPSGLLRELSGGVVRGYADVSAAFLLRSVGLTARGGRLALVQPQSLLAAKDAGAVRRRVLRDCALTALWISNEHVFDGASVFTCAPTLRVGGDRRGTLTRSATGAFDAIGSLEIDNDGLARCETWAHLGAAASGIPEICVVPAGCVGDRASATADFRDQYYGLDGFLVEDAELGELGGARERDFPRIVTAGLIDPAVCRWGDATTRILKRKWDAPRIDLVRMRREGELGSWVEARLGPKVLVATQTRVLEVYADGAGRYVPSVPLISVTPTEPSDLWRLAAAIASPVCTAIAMQRYAGAALNTRAIKLSAKQVLALPLPANEAAWEEASGMYRAAQEASGDEERVEQLLAYGARVCAAYGLCGAELDDVLGWWSENLRPKRLARRRRLASVATRAAKNSAEV